MAYGIPEGGYIGSFSMWSEGSEISTGYSDSSDWFFQTMFVCATVSIVSGAVAERIKIWPFFETQLARGIDEFKLNPIAKIPRGEATPLKMFSFSREFENEW